MEFQRWLLTEKYEIYNFTHGIDSIAYLLFEDTFEKANKEFGEKIFDNDFEANSNQIIIKCATLAGFTEENRQEILSFCDKIIGFKPSIDYLVDFSPIQKEVEFNYPYEDGFKEMIHQLNAIFKINIVVNDLLSFNNLIQK